MREKAASALAEEIGKRLKQARLNRYLTQSEVANLAGVARKTVLNAEKGKAHVDYKKPGSFSYAELFGIARQLRLSATEAEQILKRMTFNIIARNHDDHSKNVAFMLKNERWSLEPAYDLAYSYKPGNKWVNSHWMLLV